MSDDMATGMIISAIVIVIAVGVACRREIARWLQTKRRKATADYAALAAWPTQSQILPCESWVGKTIEEIIAPPLYVREAEQIAAQRWVILEMSPRTEEGCDDL